MPFGKYKGFAISECPVDYLDWLIGQAWFEQPEWKDLKEEIEKFLENCPEWQRL